MSRIGRTLATVVAVAWSSWSCASTAPDATPEVAAIIVSPATSTLALKAQLPLQAQVQDGSGAVVPGVAITWTVQSPKIVSVSAAGVVTALAVGTSQVAANAFGKSGISTIVVIRARVANVVLQPSRGAVTVGATVQLSAAAVDANGAAMADRAITWATSNPGIANVNGSGLVTGVGAGTATITAASEGKSSTASVNVSPAPITSVTISPSSANVSAGQVAKLTATVKDANGTVVTSNAVAWTSNDTQVAAPNSTGKLTADATTSKSGSATITASVGGVNGTATITVNPGAVATVTVSAPSKNLKAGNTMQLTATALDIKGNAVPNQSFYWFSSNTNTATVSSSGVVSAKGAGNVTITAATSPSGGKSGTVQLTVK